MIELIPIWPTPEANADFKTNAESSEILDMTLNYYKVIGFNTPWICYFVSRDGKLVGSAGFKGAPLNNKVEIAYGTFEAERGKGIGTEICRQLVALALLEDKNVVITARTLPEENHSTKILRKNSFTFVGSVIDPDDGEVWEWIYNGES